MSRIGMDSLSSALHRLFPGRLLSVSSSGWHIDQLWVLQMASRLERMAVIVSIIG